MKNRSKQLSIFLILIVVSASAFSQGYTDKKAPVKPALLVIDIQNAFLGMVPEREKEVAMTNINHYIDLFRSYGFPIIRIYHTSKEYGVLPGEEPFAYPKSVNIKPEDPMVIKTYPDGFNKTDLDEVIKAKGSNTLFLCGLSAVGCVLATYIGAMNHDYKVFMIKDAIMSHNSDYTNNIEIMFDAVNYEVIGLILENARM